MITKKEIARVIELATNGNDVNTIYELMHDNARSRDMKSLMKYTCDCESNARYMIECVDDTRLFFDTFEKMNIVWKKFLYNEIKLRKNERFIKLFSIENGIYHMFVYWNDETQRFE